MRQLPESLPPLSVLIVDDEPHIRELLALLLEDLGFIARTAQNGDHALQVFHEKPSSIVLTDIKMPGKDGIALLREIKAHSPETEVIMISGHGDMDLAIQSLKFEAADFITKPIDEDLLTIALRKVTERIRLRAQVRAYTQDLERLVEEKSAALLAMERRLAASQVMEGMAQALFALCEAAPSPGILPPLPLAVTLHDASGTVLHASPAAQHMLGSRQGDPSTAIYVHAQDADWVDPFQEAQKSRHPVRRQELLRTAGGRVFPAEVWISPVQGSSSCEELFLELILDRSEVERLHEALRASQHKFQLLFDAVPCAITVQDRQLHIVEANAAFRRDFGAPQGAPCYTLFKRRNEPCPDCPVLATFADGQPHQHETVVTTLQGEQRNILIWTAPISFEDNTATHVLEVATDITLIRSLQDHLTSLGMMLGSMSHGLKGLLMALDGGAYRVEKGIQTGDMNRVKSGWETVRHRIQQIRKTALDILYYSKNRTHQFQPQSLEKVANDLKEMISSRAETHHIAFSADIISPQGSLALDDAAFTSAMANIVENAVDACRMETSRHDHRITLRIHSESSWAVITISDTGIGMDQDTLDKMFTLFFSSKGALGTGIGMFVTHEIIQAHGGRIEVKSAPHQGTSFQVFLPLLP
ncbi:MAG: Multi-sensor signal transduction histidine kinase [Desulfomicrobiaceae bacterium]|jgi:PAS domain S-box-containing protein|nr:Multi-sensor signal transduction histidine kinase [Desulfomicrobiaceae bacterium]